MKTKKEDFYEKFVSLQPDGTGWGVGLYLNDKVMPQEIWSWIEQNFISKEELLEKLPKVCKQPLRHKGIDEIVESFFKNEITFGETKEQLHTQLEEVVKLERENKNKAIKFLVKKLVDELTKE